MINQNTSGLDQLMRANATQPMPTDNSQLKQALIAASQDSNYAKSIGMSQISALAKLQDMVAMEKAGANQQALQGGNQPSVAEQIVAEALPNMGGVASIPFDENLYQAASGGIVSFAEGGDVKSYAGLYESDVRLSGSQQYALERERAEKERELAYAKIKDAILSRTGTPSSWRYSLTGGVLGSPYQAAAPAAEKEYKKQLETQADAINRIKYAGTMLEYGPMAGMLPQTNVDSLAMPSVIPAAAEVPLPAVDMRIPVERANLTDTGSAGKTPAGPRPPAAPSAAPTGLQTLVAPEIKYTPIPEADRTPLVDARGEMDKYMGLIGEDPYAAKAAERIGQMESENAKYKEQYPWMALAEAGFGMAAGRSPFALQNIAEGGQRGVTALARGRKDVQEQEEKIFNAEAKVAEAKRAVQLSAAKFGLESEQTAKANRRLEDAEERKAQREIDYRNKVFEVDIKKLQVTERNADRRLQQQLKSAEKQAATAVQRERIAAMSKSIESTTSVYNTAVKEYNDLASTGMATETALKNAEAAVIAAKKDYDLARTYANSILGTTGAEYLGVEK